MSSFCIIQFSRLASALLCCCWSVDGLDNLLKPVNPDKQYLEHSWNKVCLKLLKTSCWTGWVYSMLKTLSCLLQVYSQTSRAYNVCQVLQPRELILYETVWLLMSCSRDFRLGCLFYYSFLLLTTLRHTVLQLHVCLGVCISSIYSRLLWADRERGEGWARFSSVTQHTDTQRMNTSWHVTGRRCCGLLFS